jgi:hypothetical protein
MPKTSVCLDECWKERMRALAKMLGEGVNCGWYSRRRNKL